jgi:hypothetical protein
MLAGPWSRSSPASTLFTHDLCPLMLAMLPMARAFSRSNMPALRLTLGPALVVFWILPLYITLVAWHCMCLWFLVLMMSMIGTPKLAAESVGSAPSQERHGYPHP